MSDNWIVSNLENALSGWNDKLSEIWGLLTQSPATFKGGTIWSLILSINNALVGIGYGLLTSGKYLRSRSPFSTILVSSGRSCGPFVMSSALSGFAPSVGVSGFCSVVGCSA